MKWTSHGLFTSRNLKSFLFFTFSLVRVDRRNADESLSSYRLLQVQRTLPFVELVIRSKGSVEELEAQHGQTVALLQGSKLKTESRDSSGPMSLDSRNRASFTRVLSKSRWMTA